ncbi:heme/copper-type cytochrome/quinol oxidase subunit 1 [Arthrobacter ginsengisoli]|uniref:Heme/copper-type cytochrome/quinol oxidase subunit 1 n=1 Tax=Arthrobacter ginsengisoli TaxID=1356565 RepID=A0ABU1UBQ3_9MICC|nr:hypothetical protein [Arthrobacter ginsengisoli]MDR7082540.1 heme/copper-type cytochrome/quinol oxidase subunit 1 [Arthrobacter ginsengisoli]
MNPTGEKESGPSRGGWLARVAVPLLAGALLAAGMVLLSLPVRQESFGWFAYAPLSQSFAAPGLLIMDAEKWAGVVLLAVGLLTFAFWSGYHTGRRSSRGSRRSGTGGPSAG